jgi:hypothetical protein
MEESKISKQFISGLKSYNLTQEEIKNWKYCGGNSGSDLNYFKLKYPDEKIPEYVDKCVCGHNIVQNCYITDGNEFLTLGNCCVKRFISKENQGRTCERCGEPHRNRKDDKCDDCRMLKCRNCPLYSEPEKFGLCSACSLLKGKCKLCGRETKSLNFKLCWTCKNM